MLTVALEIWALLHALDLIGPRWWLILAGASLASLFVHSAGAAAASPVRRWHMRSSGQRRAGQVLSPLHPLTPSPMLAPGRFAA